MGQLSPLPRFCLALWQVPSPTLLCTLSFTCVLFWALTWARLRSTVVWATALRRLSRTTASCLSTTVLPLLPLVLSFTEVHSSVCRTPSRLSTLTRKISLLSAWPPSSLLRKSPFLLPASSPTPSTPCSDECRLRLPKPKDQQIYSNVKECITKILAAE